jgi:hypothetical protein
MTFVVNVLKSCINYIELVVIQGTLHCMFPGCY